MNFDSVLSWAGSQLLAGELPVAFGLGVVLALFLVVVAIALVVLSARSAGAAQLARTEAEAKLSAAQDLADEVRRMQSQMELTAREQEAAFQRALSEHHANCATQHVERAPAPVAEATKQSASDDHHDDDHDDHHDDHKKKPPQKKHSLAGDDDELDEKRFSFRALFGGRDRDRE